MEKKLNIENQLSLETIERMYDWLRSYMDENCIYRVAPGEEKLPTANKRKTAIWQIYPRRGLYNAQFAHTVGILFWLKFKDLYKEKPFQIAGLETGATPVITAILMTARYFNINITGFTVRKDRKKYGLFNRFEGIVDYNLPVLLVDDFCNSKNTMYLAKKYCEKEGLEIYSPCFAVANKLLGDVKPDSDKYIGENLKIEFLLTLPMLKPEWKKYKEYMDQMGKEIKPWVLEKYKED